MRFDRILALAAVFAFGLFAQPVLAAPEKVSWSAQMTEALGGVLDSELGNGGGMRYEPVVIEAPRWNRRQEKKRRFGFEVSMTYGQSFGTSRTRG